MKKKLLILFILSIWFDFAYSQNLETRHSIIENFLIQYIEKHPEKSTLQDIYRNIDFTQIKYKANRGYYSKKIEIDGLQPRTIRFFIEISTTDIQIGYIKESYKTIKIKELIIEPNDNNLNPKESFMKVTNGSTWVFNIDENNNIQLDHVNAIG